MKTRIRLVQIVAASSNGKIGRDGQLPWKRIGIDTAHLIEKTAGKICVIGRRSYETALEDFENVRFIVVSSSGTLAPEKKMEVTPDLASALAVAERLVLSEGLSEEVCVLGGQRLYEETYSMAHEIWLTRVLKDVEGEIEYLFFPEKDPSFEIISKIAHQENGLDFTIYHLKRS